MPYIMLFLNRLLWVVQNFLILHFQILASYFYTLNTWLIGDRVTAVLIEHESYTSYRKNRLDEHMGTDETGDEDLLEEPEEPGEEM